MKALNVFVAVWMCALHVGAADVLTEKLQRGLFEEEANHNLDAAIKEYQAVVAQSDEQRKVIATALFRLGECYRKLGRTNEATAQYQRLLRDFSDQEQLTQLSRSMLGSNSVTAATRTSVAEQMKRKGAEEEAQRLASWREQVRDNPDLVNKLELGPPLHQAVNRGWLSVVNFLLSQRADPNGRDNQLQTPLHVAVAVDRREIVEVLLKSGADVNARDNSKRTPLHVAAGSGFLAIAQILIDAKADMDLLDSQRDTPLMIAVSRSYRAMTELLLARGANPNKGSVASETSTGTIYAKNPLSIAVAKDSSVLVSLLVSNKADVNARVSRDNVGAPLVSHAAGQGFVNTMQLLLAAGANPSQRSVNDKTALMFAAAIGQTDAVRALLAHPVNVKEANQDGLTALHFAAQNGSLETLQLLIESGAPVNVTAKDGVTPLSLAAYSNRSGAVKVLLEAGADPDVVAYGNTPLSAAQTGMGNQNSTDARQAATEIAQLLLARGANPFFQRQQSMAIGYRTNALATPFSRGTNDWNRYTLLEVLSGSIGTFPWADWANAYIERVSGQTLTNVPVNLAAMFATGQCSNDIWLEWGDRVLLPELDHPLNARAPAMPTNAFDMFKQCLPRTIRLVVKGVTNEMRLTWTGNPMGAMPPSPGLPGMPAIGGAFSGVAITAPTSTVRDETPTLASFRLKEVVYKSGMLRASSDPTRVRVTRGDRVWTVNLQTISFSMESAQSKLPAALDLWLRDGDVIEVPEKP